MSPFKSLWVSLRALFRPRAAESELDEELRIHLEMEIEHNIAQGMSPAAARRAARVALGGVDQTKEASRDAWGWRILQDFWRDGGFALKSLRRTPGFTVIAVLTLGLGIGVNTVMFAFVRDTVLRPLVRDESLGLTTIYNSRAGADRDFRHSSYAEFETLRESTDVFADVAASFYSIEAVGVKNDLHRRLIGIASQNYLSLIGGRPLHGRFFNTAESQLEAAIPVVVANHSLWQRLGFPANFIGSTLRVNQRDYTVIGITPRGFVGEHVSIGPEIWLPFGEAHFYRDQSLRSTELHALGLTARLAPGLSIETARARLPALDERLNDRALPEDDGPRHLVLAPPSRADLGSSSPNNESYLNLFALLSMGLSAAVLIVACLNLANMVLARGAARRKEIAIRLSLGASRGRIVRQLSTEGLVLCLLGSVAGLLLSVWADSGIYQISLQVFSTSNFTLGVSPFLDGSMMSATVVFCLIATLASSVGPALRITRPNIVDDLKQTRSGGTGSAPWRRFFTLGNTLVIAQIALSLALLFSAALFVRSSLGAKSMDLGFQTADQLVANLDYGMTDLSDPAIARQQQALLARLTPLAGAGNVALASDVPYNFELGYHPVFPAADAAPISLDQAHDGRSYAGFTAVSRDYFSLLGINVLRGRTFTTAESTEPDGPGVAIIDQSLARSLFGDRDAIGQRVFLGEEAAASGDLARSLEIVGIVRSPRDHVFEDAAPARIYRPLGQAPESNIYLHLGTSEPQRRAPTIRRELQAFDPATPVLFIRPLSSFVENNVNSLLVKLAALIFGIFGGIALLLAIVGVYGVKSHAVTRRTREIGIRMALGAHPREVMGLILRQGALQTLVGLMLGTALSLAASRALASMIYQATQTDVLALIVSGAVLGLAVLLACYLPARRATRVDPATTLRSE
ncbi:ADOP family duplicated permease [Synoicihabitans lomoniglobus]|uniref:ADOP family duplicated permease n=1 Tax=Synoicihabitans lomoniglobus TaxID=2909285 RepID=A0AAE9ZSD6_9BACT|nr:ADOP family duplicated permease [Opitutaceae bacterium LMO-M01]WED64365.1 ADOP family duplicated permease [Opitutaceae bacterium LMO-M01]